MSATGRCRSRLSRHRWALSQNVPGNGPPVSATTKYDPSGEKSTPRRSVSNLEEHAALKSSVSQLARLTGFVVRLSIAIWLRSWPLASVNVPTTTILVPSGDTAICATRRVPARLLVKLTVTFGSTAPVVVLTAPKRPRTAPSIFVSEPPMYSLAPETTSDSTSVAWTVAENPAVGVPVARLSLARRFRGCPAMFENVPPAKTAVAPGAVARV